MKIINKPMKKVKFELLTAGEVFELNREGTVITCMRVKDKQLTYNAVDLTNGILTYFGRAEEVVPLYDAILLREQE